MNFKIWLTENQKDIRFAGFISNGTVIVYIDGTRYMYLTDPFYHQKWKQMSKFRPWMVLKDIKDQIKIGKANQL